jgi:hypothetical protein
MTVEGLLLLAVLIAALYIVVPTATSLISQEATGWIPILCQKIVAIASRQLPEGHRPRWTEEVNADIEEFKGRPISAIVHSIDVLLHARELGRQLQGTPSPGNSPTPIEDEPAQRSSMPRVLPVRPVRRVSTSPIWPVAVSCLVVETLIARRFDERITPHQIELAIKHINECRYCRDFAQCADGHEHDHDIAYRSG